MNETIYEIFSASWQVHNQQLSSLIHWDQATMLEKVEAIGFTLHIYLIIFPYGSLA